jgi:hypothetical protein
MEHRKEKIGTFHLSYFCYWSYGRDYEESYSSDCFARERKIKEGRKEEGRLREDKVILIGRKKWMI